MTYEIERSTVVDTALFAAVGVCAALGLWSGLSTVTPIDAKIAVPLVWAGLTAVLLTARRSAVRYGVKAGIEYAHVDPVTRLPSQAIAKRLLNLEFAAAERGRELAIVFFSIDDFSKLTNQFGPDETKRILVGIGAVLKKRTRDMNISARYDENGTFISVLGSVPSSGAANFASKVSKDLRMLKFGDQPLSVSSIVCAYDPTMQSVNELITKAHHALSDARRRGGNLLVTDGAKPMGEREGYAIL